MQSTTSPTKEQIRNYMQERKKAVEPPPSPERIREILGWNLIPMARAARS